jgi:hypothetical protein
MAAGTSEAAESEEPPDADEAAATGELAALLGAELAAAELPAPAPLLAALPGAALLGAALLDVDVAPVAVLLLEQPASAVRAIAASAAVTGCQRGRVNNLFLLIVM